MRTLLAQLCTCCLLTALGAAEIPLTVSESAGVARSGEPVSSGVPLARGTVADVASLSLRDDAGRAVPAQFRALASWPDGSARWVLCDFVTDLESGATRAYRLQLRGRAAVPRDALQIEESDERIVVDGGALRFAVDRQHFGLFSELSVNGAPMLGDGPGAVLVLPGGREMPLAEQPVEAVVVEERGPLRCVVRANGRFAGVSDDRIEWICRITAYAGQPLAKVDFWLRNHGGWGYNQRWKHEQWFEFDAFGLRLDLAPMADGGALTASCEGAEVELGGDARFVVEQHGETAKQRDQGYQSLSYVVRSGGEDLATGHTTDGVTRIAGAGGSLSIAVDRFWQNYEKAIEVAGDSATVWLWPAFGEWPRTGLSRGKSPEGPRTPGSYYLSGATQKGYSVVLDFRGDAAAAGATANQPLMALAEPAWYADSEGFGYFAPQEFTPADAEAAEAVAVQNRWAHDSFDPEADDSIYAARRSGIFGWWYGWMDFGDINWHSRGMGPSSLHYDWPWVGLLYYLRSGERMYFDVAREMAVHRRDVDQRWSDQGTDYDVYRGLTTFEMNFADIHGGSQDGHMNPIPSHNWVSGLIAYHLLTGDPMARESALRNCDVGIWGFYLSRLQEGKGGGQTRIAGWSIENLVAAYELTGDQKYLDWCFISWNKHLKPLWKEHGVSFYKGEQLGLQMFYCTHGLIDLHRVSQDPEILEYLRAMVAAVDAVAPATAADPLPKRWDYGQELAVFVSDAIAYLAWLDRDEALLDKAAKYYRIRFREEFAHHGLFYSSRAFGKETAKALRNGHYWLWAERKMRSAE